MSKIYFVWLRTPHGPAPQKWYGDQVRGDGRFKFGPAGTGNLLALHELTKQQAAFSINQLQIIFPPPQIEPHV